MGVLTLGQAQYRLQTPGDWELGMNGGWVGRDWTIGGGGRALQQKGPAGAGAEQGADTLGAEESLTEAQEASRARTGPGQSWGRAGGHPGSLAQVLRWTQ